MHNNKKLSTLILIGKVTKSPLHVCTARITVLMVHKIPRVQEQKINWFLIKGSQHFINYATSCYIFNKLASNAKN